MCGEMLLSSLETCALGRPLPRVRLDFVLHWLSASLAEDRPPPWLELITLLHLPLLFCLLALPCDDPAPCPPCFPIPVPPSLLFIVLAPDLVPLLTLPLPPPLALSNPPFPPPCLGPRRLPLLLNSILLALSMGFNRSSNFSFILVEIGFSYLDSRYLIISDGLDPGFSRSAEIASSNRLWIGCCVLLRPPGLLPICCCKTPPAAA